MIGKIFQLAKVPVGTVVSSPSCRAKQTARLAFGRIDLVSNALAHTPVVNDGNAMAFKSALQRILVSVPLESGKNTAITAHANTLENHPDLFAEGVEFLQGQRLVETGFYVIKRERDGSLRIIQQFKDLGVFAANAINLEATPPKH